MYNKAMQPDQEKQKFGQHDLDFIMQTEVPTEPSFLSKLQSKWGLIFLGLCAGLILILALVFSIMQNQTSNEQRQKLVGLAQTETELIRLANLASSQATEENTKTRASEIANSLNGSLAKTKQLIQARGGNSGEADFSAGKNSQNDSRLVEAIQNNSFDTVFSELVDEQLLSYQQQLIAVQQNANSTEKQVLEDSYSKANKLLGLFDEAPQAKEGAAP